MTRPAPRPGIIGLGMIGGGIAFSLARSGQVPAVFDVREDATGDLDGVPAQSNHRQTSIASLIRPQIGDIYHGRLSDPLPIVPGGHG